MIQAINNPREEIDAIDREILRLLNERAAIALRVGAAKTVADTSLVDPARESEVLTRLTSENPGPFDATSIENIFQRIIDESLHLQQVTYHKPSGSSGNSDFASPQERKRVAFLGEHGTFSETAALGILGEDHNYISYPTFEDLYKAIADGEADYIISPLENSLVGSIHRCYDLLLTSDLSIVAEIILPVSHFLIGSAAANFETVRTVESHPAALGQCERFFSAHPNLKGIAADDTAGSVKRAVESGDETRAAIGGRRAAEIYGGKILREHIEDHSENYTRFVLLAAGPDESEKGSKISLVVRLKNEPGSLHSALRPFVRRNIDLTKIESRPIKGQPSEFNFYLDIQAPVNESELRGALDEIKEQAAEVRYLGRYPTIALTRDIS
ncbi:MAG TPA: prephenate dehydratase [Pyrinomonadaceae bacterium]|nr:prephenate dehydratase [Pyrinomonadaceae bacterium]